ncbi:Flp family type IVb pilin [Acidithiobacillus sp. IBUN Pt1247-S3]|uniref:Flp family type IVb pilin n=1 Tax=Acidithiobacillus sp. IBUN Pt1247-S3 TaxID=3166642 RepID=UPI0034E6019B
MKQEFVRKKACQSGQGMTEYLIIVALIAISAIAVFSFFGQTLRHQMAGIAHELAGKDSSGDVSKAQGASDNASSTATRNRKMSDYTSAKDLN